MFHMHIYGPNRKSMVAGMMHSFPIIEDEQGPVGPHTQAQICLLVSEQDLEAYSPLEEEAEAWGVSILVHPVQEDEVAAHTAEAWWYGPPVPLNLEFFGA